MSCVINLDHYWTPEVSVARGVYEELGIALIVLCSALEW